MQVNVDDKSGFCYGVIRAIETAETELGKESTLFSLGDIVHNTVEVNRLKEKGLSTISSDDIDKIKGKKMLIRAHGEPPATYEKARQNSVLIVDCTCPVVLKLQERIKKNYENIKKKNGQLVIFGKRGHAEINGLTGQVDGDAIVIENISEIDRIDFTRPVSLFAQTTKNPDEFTALRNEIIRRMQAALGTDVVPIEFHNTICNQVSNRTPHLEQFSRENDVVIFVTGKQSSNGKVLYENCKRVNPRTYSVESEADLNPEWFVDCRSVGVCGATSTPKWLMEQVANVIRKL